MKGIVFTEFFELVEATFGYAMVDRIILESRLPNNGAYTGVGNYPHSEMFALLGHLSRETNIPAAELLRLYGRYLFGYFAKNYSQFFQQSDAFSVLERVDNHIHVEVYKLYPDAELPRFDCCRPTATSLEMVYHSARSMADFAQGLIEATLLHFDEKADIHQENIEPDGSVVRFSIQKQPV